jgi:hypothetical protein
VDSFFYWWEKAYAEHSSFLIYEMDDPFTSKTGLHSDPGLGEIMEKVGLDIRKYFEETTRKLNSGLNITGPIPRIQVWKEFHKAFKIEREFEIP